MQFPGWKREKLSSFFTNICVYKKKKIQLPSPFQMETISSINL